MLVVSELSRLVWISEVISILGLENLAAGAETELKREWRRVNSTSMKHKSREWDKCWEKETFLPLFLVFLIHSFLSHKSYMQDHSSYFCMKYHRTPIFDPKKKKNIFGHPFLIIKITKWYFFHNLHHIYILACLQQDRKKTTYLLCLWLLKPVTLWAKTHAPHVLHWCASTKSGLVNEPNISLNVHLFETPLSILVT